MSKFEIKVTPEQLDAFKAVLATFGPEQRTAVLKTWQIGQIIGYRNASKVVFANVEPGPYVVGVEDVIDISDADLEAAA